MSLLFGQTRLTGSGFLKNVPLITLCLYSDDSSYEDPMRKIFDLVGGMSPLTQLFVDLLPEKFT